MYVKYTSLLIFLAVLNLIPTVNSLNNDTSIDGNTSTSIDEYGNTSSSIDEYGKYDKYDKLCEVKDGIMELNSYIKTECYIPPSNPISNVTIACKSTDSLSCNLNLYSSQTSYSAITLTNGVYLNIIPQEQNTIYGPMILFESIKLQGKYVGIEFQGDGRVKVEDDCYALFTHGSSSVKN